MIAVVYCVFGSMTAISANSLPSGSYKVKIGSYQALGAGAFNTVGFTLTSPEASTIKYEWKSLLATKDSYHVQLDTTYFTTNGARNTVIDYIDVIIMGYYSGHLLQTPDIDMTKVFM